MTAAIGASAAAILLILATAAQAQDPAAPNPATGAVATQPVRDTRPTTAEPPKVDPKLLFDVIDALTRPRPAPPPAVAPAPAEPAATPSLPATEPKPAAVAVAPAPEIAPPVVPRAALAPPVPPRPAPSAAPAAPPAAADDPLPAEVVPPAPPPAVTLNAQPAPPEAPAPEPVREPASAFPNSWLLLGLIAAAAIAAASTGVQRARRIARTRAALSLEPRLDMPAGTGSAKGLALASPPVAIRARLDWGDTR